MAFTGDKELALQNLVDKDRDKTIDESDAYDHVHRNRYKTCDSISNKGTEVLHNEYTGTIYYATDLLERNIQDRPE